MVNLLKKYMLIDILYSKIIKNNYKQIFKILTIINKILISISNKWVWIILNKNRK